MSPQLTRSEMVMPHQMPAAFFLLCVALATAPGVTWAEVVKDFEKCKEFFYMGTEPTGFDENYIKICQRYNNHYYYATLYSTEHRTPLYSAYILDPHCSDHTKRSRSWFIEPQVSSASDSGDMSRQDSEDIKKSQAVDMDYAFSGMERGQLKPSSYQCGRNDLSTYTLTNAVPMDPAFSNVYWRSWQENVKSILYLYAQGGTTYIITGAVPSSQRIPVPDFSDPNSGSNQEEHSRVSVPTHIWTAICFRHHIDSEKSFSFGYAGSNSKVNDITAMTIQELHNKLSSLYGDRMVNIFSDSCSGSAELSDKLIERVTVESIQFEGANLPDGLLRILKTAVAQSLISYRENLKVEKYPKVKDIYVGLNIIDQANDQSEWFDKLEDMKKRSSIACVLTSEANSSLRVVREHHVMSGDLAEFTCDMQPEKSSAGSVITADGTRCTGGTSCVTSCKTAQGEKDCCAYPCLYNETVHTFMCSSRSDSISCSPQYSSITHTGQQCRKDHQCATYGEDYYWCYTGRDDWDYCSSPYMRSKAKSGARCRVNHSCGRYSKSYYWCYINDKNNWEYCCLSDDPYSALSGKTCRSDHPCGYHGKGYLWCYTTDGKWDYCCTKQ